MLSQADCQVIEGQTPTEEAEFYAAVQRAINAGAWNWQGHYGRTMMAAIKAGDCLLGRATYDDAYGNRVPSRDEVEPGTQSSYAFVAMHRGEPWADRLAALS